MSWRSNEEALWLEQRDHGREKEEVVPERPARDGSYKARRATGVGFGRVGWGGGDGKKTAWFLI